MCMSVKININIASLAQVMLNQGIIGHTPTNVPLWRNPYIYSMGTLIGVHPLLPWLKWQSSSFRDLSFCLDNVFATMRWNTDLLTISTSAETNRHPGSWGQDDTFENSRKGGGFKYLLFSPRSLGFHDPIWRSYFANGLVKNHQLDSPIPLLSWPFREAKDSDLGARGDFWYFLCVFLPWILGWTSPNPKMKGHLDDHATNREWITVVNHISHLSFLQVYFCYNWWEYHDIWWILVNYLPHSSPFCFKIEFIPLMNGLNPSLQLRPPDHHLQNKLGPFLSHLTWGWRSLVLASRSNSESLAVGQRCWTTADVATGGAGKEPKSHGKCGGFVVSGILNHGWSTYPPLTYPPQKYGLNKALLRETNG